MKLIDQLKTTQGKVPVSKAEMYRGDDGIDRLHFTLQSGDISSLHSLSSNLKSKDVQLEDLAFLWDETGRIPQERIEKLAQKMGPLFCDSEYERVSDWIAEATMAKDVISIQEVINGDRPTSTLSATDNKTQETLVAKSIIHNKIKASTFLLYSYMLPLGDTTNSKFYSHMPAFPHFRRFTTSNSFDYVFINRLEKDEESSLFVTLFSFERDITALDFVLALEACSIDDDTDIQSLMVQVVAETGLTLDALQTERENTLFASSGTPSLVIFDNPIDKDDMPHIQHLVQAVISLRLAAIGVDVFRSDESDDFLIFPMYASYLWYGFAKKLGKVKIGYCEQCGRGFSLSGHRGMPRRFCSEKCKTEAKNNRAKQQRDEVRRLFLEENLDVAEIVLRVYANELKKISSTQKTKELRALQARVRKELAHYPELKRKVQKELGTVLEVQKTKTRSETDSESPINLEQAAPLTYRCIQERILTKDSLKQYTRQP